MGCEARTSGLGEHLEGGPHQEVGEWPTWEAHFITPRISYQNRVTMQETGTRSPRYEDQMILIEQTTTRSFKMIHQCFDNIMSYFFKEEK